MVGICGSADTDIAVGTSCLVRRLAPGARVLVGPHLPESPVATAQRPSTDLPPPQRAPAEPRHVDPDTHADATGHADTGTADTGSADTGGHADPAAATRPTGSLTVAALAALARRVTADPAVADWTAQAGRSVTVRLALGPGARPVD
jgi:hypothetical protein